ncbi:MAG: serine/threonine-protein kinase [Planctomycetaceae bacterium]
MAPTARELTRLLTETGLLTSEDVLRCRQQSGLTDDDISGQSLLELLVRGELLTRFQARTVFGGRAQDLVLGNYVVLDKLGEGGMGQVFRARHRRMKREVALKVLTPQYVRSATALRRFHREVEAAARLNHPNIVTAYDADESNGIHFLAMECVSGTDLESIVADGGSLPTVTAVGYAIQAARGLAYAHAQGVVHRDIKPSNLLLDLAGTVKILDMGLARLDDSAASTSATVADLTSPGVLMGTVDFLSPEQAMDAQSADYRSDIYALGCTLYFLVSGTAMYESDGVMQRVMAHQTAPIPLLPGADSELQRLFERMVAKNPDDRIGPAQNLVDALEAWLAEHTNSVAAADLAGPPSRATADDAPDSTRSPLAPAGTSPTTGTRATAASDTLWQVAPNEVAEFSAASPASGQASRRRTDRRATAGRPDSKPSTGGKPGNRSHWRVLVGGGLIALVLMGGWLVRSRPASGPNDVSVSADTSVMPVDRDMATKAPAIAAASAIASDSPEAVVELPDAEIAPNPEVAEKVPPDSGRDDGSAIAGAAEYSAAQPVRNVSHPAVPNERGATSVDESQIGTLASVDLRMHPRPDSLPKFSARIRPGEPFGDFAAVSRPARVNDVLTWSIEPLLHRSGYRSIDVRSDGLIATGGDDNAIRLWTAEFQLVKVLAGHESAICSVQFSPDGRTLASASPGPRAALNVWHVDSGQLLKTFDVDNWPGRVAWLPDGTLLIHAAGTVVELLDPQTADRRHSAEGAAGTFIGVSPDSRRFVLGGKRTARVFDANSLQLLTTIDMDGDCSVDWSPDGRWIAAADDSGTVVLDTRSFQERHRLDVKGLVSFSPDSTSLAVANGTSCTAFNTLDWSQCFEVPSGRRATDVAWTPDSRQILMPNARVDSQTGQALPMLPQSSTRPVVTAVADDGSRVATLTSNRLRVFDGQTGAMLNETEFQHQECSQLLWQPGGGLLLRLCTDGSDSADRISVIDADSGKVKHRFLQDAGRIWRACWSPDGKSIASVGDDGVCRIRDVESGTEQHALLHNDPLWWVQWSDDSAKIACGSAFGGISVWNAENGKRLQEFKTLSAPMQPPRVQRASDGPFCFLKDSNQILYLAGMTGFELLDVRTGQISPAGQAEMDCGERLSAGWSPDFSVLGVYGSYGEFHLRAVGQNVTSAIRFFHTPHWLADSRRLLGGDNDGAWVSGYDFRRNRRLGTLLAELPDNAWAMVSPEGDFVSSDNFDDHVAVVALLRDGRQLTLSLDEFQGQFGWTSRPEKVRFLK